MASRAKTYCVVGSPIAHSKSPRIHERFARQFGLSLRYERVEVQPGALARFARGFFADGGDGMNVTVPLKEEAVQAADVVQPRAATAGAANTLWQSAAGELVADNTDGAGLVRDLTRNAGFALAGRSILLVGAGGAARGVIPALLAERPASLVVANRTAARAEALATRFAPLGPIASRPLDRAGAGYDLVINATSLSMAGAVPGLDPAAIAPESLCVDLFYAPAETAFLAWCGQQGAQRRRDGLGMLVEQAAVAFALWHGLEPATAPVIALLRG